MRKLIALLILAAVGASAQVTNTVNISNSLLGPVTNVFTNTQISVGEAIITGAVFNASVTNTFSPVNNITNEDYYLTVYQGGFFLYKGDARQIVGTLNFKY